MITFNYPNCVKIIKSEKKIPQGRGYLLRGEKNSATFQIKNNERRRANVKDQRHL